MSLSPHNLLEQPWRCKPQLSSPAKPRRFLTKQRIRMSRTPGIKRRGHTPSQPPVSSLSRQEKLESTGARRDHFKLHHMELSRSLSTRQGQLVSVRTRPPQLSQPTATTSEQQCFMQHSSVPKIRAAPWGGLVFFWGGQIKHSIMSLLINSLSHPSSARD